MSIEAHLQLWVVDGYRINRAVMESNFSAIGIFDNEAADVEVRSGDVPVYSQRDMQLAVDRAFAYGVEQGNVYRGVGWLLAGAISASMWWMMLVWAWSWT